MGKSVHRRHNKDGSITKTTTYRHKNIFGTTVSDTYTERIYPKDKTTPKEHRSLSYTSIGIILIALGVIFAVPMIKEGGWGILIISIPLICIGFSMLPINIPSLFHKEEKAKPRVIAKTENGWICPDCETENSNTSTICKGCGRYK